MSERRTITCGERQFTIRRYPDQVIGVFDEQGHMILGWPESTVFGKGSLEERTDEDWCATLASVRKIA